MAERGPSSSRQPSSPRKNLQHDLDASAIGMSVLNRTGDGRSQTFETRMALQREVEGTRTQIRGSVRAGAAARHPRAPHCCRQERAADQMRRQAQSSRDEAALHRADNIRLQDDLRSAKSRLSAALDAQESVLRKNAELHSQVQRLQGSESALREEIVAKEGQISFFQEQCSSLEGELRGVTEAAAASERRLQDELSATLETLTRVQGEALGFQRSEQAWAAKAEALQSENDRQAAELLAAGKERQEVRDELQANMSRMAGIQRAQAELRSQVDTKTAELQSAHGATAAVRSEVATATEKKSELEAQLSHSSALVRELEREGAAMAARFEAEVHELRRTLDARTAESATLSRTLGTLSDQVAMKDAEMARLHAEVRALRGRDAEAIKLAEAERHLSAKLSDTQAKLATFESEAARLAAERDSISRDAEARARGYAAREAATVAKERALVDHAALLSRAVQSRSADARRAEVAASRALASYHALRSDVSVVDRVAMAEARRRDLLLGR